MAKQFDSLDEKLKAFIARQHVFFTGSAAAGTRVNISPRSTDLLRVIDSNTVAYLDRTGSGNETAAHMKADGRLTIMLCSFEGPPLIMRLYGTGSILHRDSDAYQAMLKAQFPGPLPLGARQIVLLDIDLVQTSCGYGVPKMPYEGERDSMDRWAENKGEAGLEAWWRDENQLSLDGLPTGLMDAPKD